MGTILGLTLGSGLLLMFLSFLSPWEPRLRVQKPSHLKQELERAGFAQIRPVSLVLTGLGFGLLSGVLVLAWTRTWPIAGLLAIALAFAPYSVVHARARSRTRARREIWPDVIGEILSGVRAGMSLPETLIALGESGPPLLRSQMKLFAVDFRTTGRFDDSLIMLQNRLADPLADRIVEGLLLARQVGSSDLGKMLQELSRMIREDTRTRGELEARQSWTVNGARLAVAAPWIILLMVSTRIEAARAYSTPTGMLILSGGAAASIFAYWLMSKIGQLPEDRRITR